MNDLIVILILVALGGIALSSCLRRKKRGCCGGCGDCGGSCASCNSCQGGAHKPQDEQKPQP